MKFAIAATSIPDTSWKKTLVFTVGRHFDVATARHCFTPADPCHVLPIEVPIRVAKMLLGVSNT
jgi:hypothetical protein